MAKSVLVDLTRCIGCRGCQAACKEWNERAARKTTFKGEYTNPSRLNSDCYTRIRFEEKDEAKGPVWSFVKEQCLHCKNPACVSVCPVVIPGPMSTKSTSRSRTHPTTLRPCPRFRRAAR